MENEHKYKLLVEQASDGIHTYDFQGNILETNLKLCEMLGYTREELLQLNVRDLAPADHLIANPIRFDELRAGKTLLKERLLVRKDGTIFPVEISGRMIQEGVLQAIIRDISSRKDAEKRIKQNEEWLRNIFEASHDGILVENEGKISYVNKSYLYLFGYEDTEELIGQDVSVIIASEDVKRVTGYGKARLKDDEQPPLKYEFKGKRKDGSSVDVEASISVTNIVGRVYITTMIREIGERKRVKMLIESQKHSLEMVVKGSPLPEVLSYLTKVVEQQSERETVASILLLDDEGHLHNGASPNLPEKYLQAIDGLKADENVGTCSAAAASGKTVITADIATDPKWRKFAHLPLELGFKSAWSMPIIARDGHVLGTFGTYFRERREPTAIERQVVEILGRTAALAIERNLVEDALRRNENQLRFITDSVPLLISNVDKERRYRFVNRTYADWFGISGERVIGKHLSKVLGQAAYQALLPSIEKVLSGEEVVLELLTPYKNGKKFIHLNYIPEFDIETGEVKGFHAFVQDITERKQAEEVLKRSQEDLESLVNERTTELEKANKERIEILQQLITAQVDERRRLARDLHDQLGQQLTALRLKLGVLKKTHNGNEALNEQIGEIQKIARQLDADVDFLTWQIRPTALDDLGITAALNQYIRQWSAHFNISAEFLANRFGETNLTPEVETTLYRVAQEALNNICKHAQASKVNISLEPRDDSAILIIEDNGIGFDSDKQKAFSKSMGIIGMSERVKLVGGTLEIESAKGTGTTIYVKVPVIAAGQGNNNE